MIEELFDKTKQTSELIKRFGVEEAFDKQLISTASKLFDVQESFRSNAYSLSKAEIINALHETTQLLYIVPNYRFGDSKRFIENLRRYHIKNNLYEGAK